MFVWANMLQIYSLQYWSCTIITLSFRAAIFWQVHFFCIRGVCYTSEIFVPFSRVQSRCAVSGVTINMSCMNSDTWGCCWHSSSTCKKQGKMASCKHRENMFTLSQRTTEGGDAEKVATFSPFLDWTGSGHVSPSISSGVKRKILSTVHLSQSSRAEGGGSYNPTLLTTGS